MIKENIEITGTITPTHSNDTFATHMSKYGKGGFKTVANITERDNISLERREVGMIVYVSDLNFMYKLTDVNANTYVKINMDMGVFRTANTITERDNISVDERLLNMIVYVVSEKKFYRLTDVNTNTYVQLNNNFLSLDDTPAVYIPDTVLMVNTNGDAVIQTPIDEVGRTTFLGLDDTPINYSGYANYAVTVNVTEDALEFKEFTLDSLIDVNNYVANYLLIVNSTGDEITYIDPNQVGRTTFLSLDDTPAVYTPDTVLMVNTNGDAIIQTPIDEVGRLNFLSLDDTPINYSGYANYAVTVNVTEDALEFKEFTLDSLTDVNNYVANYLLIVNSTGDEITYIDPNQVGRTTFLGLDDTPVNYIEDKILITTTTGLEFTNYYPSQLEKIIEGGNTGWRLLGSDPANYGDIGDGAVDLSSSASASDTSGATGGYSFASGYSTTASGSYSHVEGYYSTASGDRSHAEGVNATASGDFSHAEGLRTTANNEAMHAEGKWNVTTQPATLISVTGIGVDIDNRANGFEVHTDGRLLGPNITNDIVSYDNKGLMTKELTIDNFAVTKSSTKTENIFDNRNVFNSKYTYTLITGMSSAIIDFRLANNFFIDLADAGTYVIAADDGTGAPATNNLPSGPTDDQNVIDQNGLIVIKNPTRIDSFTNIYITEPLVFADIITDYLIFSYIIWDSGNIILSPFRELNLN